MLQYMIIGNRFSGSEHVGRLAQAAGYDTSYARYFPVEGELDFTNAIDITHVGEISPTFPAWASRDTAKVTMYTLCVLDYFAVIHVINNPLYCIDKYVKTGIILSDVEKACLSELGWYETDDPYLAAALYGYHDYMNCHAMYNAAPLRIRLIPEFLESERVRRQLIHTLADWMHIAPKEVDRFRVPKYRTRLTFQSLKRKSKAAYLYANAHYEAICDYSNHL